MDINSNPLIKSMKCIDQPVLNSCSMIICTLFHLMATHLLPFTWAGVVDSQYADNQAASIAEVLHTNQCIYVYSIALH